MTRVKKTVKKTAKYVSVKVGIFGQVPTILSLPVGTTLGDLIQKMNIDTEGQTVWVNGKEEDLSTKLKNKTNVQLIGKKDSSV